MNGSIFYPTAFSLNQISRGNGQTILHKFREKRYDGSQFTYDKREKFVLSDGGTIHIDFKGESFKNGDIFRWGPYDPANKGLDISFKMISDQRRYKYIFDTYEKP